MAKHFKKYLMPDEMWKRLEPLIPHHKKDSRGGRPRKKDTRRIADGIFYRFRTSCQWNLLPRYFGTSSTLHRYFQEWVNAGVFEKLWIIALAEYDELKGIRWDHQSLDTTSVKAPLGGEKSGPNPTDRGKLGTKRSIITDSRGVVVAAAIAPANRHDSKIVKETFKSFAAKRPTTTIRKRQHFHADKGYDTAAVRRLAKNKRFISHIAKKRRTDRRGRPKIYADHYRWIVERTHSWTNRFRGGLIRWDKKAINYEALIFLSFAYSAMRASGVLG